MLFLSDFSLIIRDQTILLLFMKIWFKQKSTKALKHQVQWNLPSKAVIFFSQPNEFQLSGNRLISSFWNVILLFANLMIQRCWKCYHSSSRVHFMFWQKNNAFFGKEYSKYSKARINMNNWEQKCQNENSELFFLTFPGKVKNTNIANSGLSIYDFNISEDRHVIFNQDTNRKLNTFCHSLRYICFSPWILFPSTTIPDNI